MPFAFLIGIHGFIWILPVFVFGLQLFVQREPVVIPRSAIPLILLVAWIPVTMLQLDPGKLPLATFRWLVFAAPLFCMVWLVNQSEVRVPSARIVRLLSILWMVLITFGYLAILFPHFSTPSPIQHVEPGALLSNQYIRDLGRWNFAQVQALVTDEVGRPAAPMAYSNGWGSTLGLLTPFFVLDFFILGSPRRKRFGILVGIIGLVPIVMSLNRGLWLSVGVAFAYVALRRALQGNIKLVITIGITALFIFGALAVTTLGNTVQQRFEIASESNATRSQLYQVAFDAMKARPTGRLRRSDQRGLVARRRHPRTRLVRHGRVRVAGPRPAAVVDDHHVRGNDARAEPGRALVARGDRRLHHPSADLRAPAAAHARRYRGRAGDTRASDAPTTSATPWRRSVRDVSGDVDGSRPASVQRVRDTAKAALRQWGIATARQRRRLISSGSARSAAAPRRCGSTSRSTPAS